MMTSALDNCAISSLNLKLYYFTQKTKVSVVPPFEMTIPASHPLPDPPKSSRSKNSRAAELSSTKCTASSTNSVDPNTGQRERSQATPSTNNAQSSVKKASRRDFFDSMLLSQQKRNKEAKEKLEKARETQRHESEYIQLRCANLEADLEKKMAEHKDIKDLFDKQMDVIRPKANISLPDLCQRLSNLQNKLTSFPMTFKDALLDQDSCVVLKYFKSIWPNLHDALERLATGDKLEFSTISLLVEKLITDEVVRNIYEAPVCVSLPAVNKDFQTVSEFLLPDHSDWEVQLRLQLCKLAAMDTNSSHRTTAIMQIVNSLSTQLSHIYTYTESMNDKLTELITCAVELGVAMHAHFVIPRHLVEGKDRLDDNFVTPMQFTPVTNTELVQIVISPPFFAKEDGAYDCLLPGKAICF